MKWIATCLNSSRCFVVNFWSYVSHSWQLYCFCVFGMILNSDCISELYAFHHKRIKQNRNGCVFCSPFVKKILSWLNHIFIHFCFLFFFNGADGLKTSADCVLTSSHSELWNLTRIIPSANFIWHWSVLVRGQNHSIQCQTGYKKFLFLSFKMANDIWWLQTKWFLTHICSLTRN